MKTVKIYCLLLVVILFLPSLAYGDAVFATFKIFKEGIKQQLRIHSTVMVPDSELTDWANLALVWTSVDIGGVESRVKILTVVGQPFYELPDTLVEILSQTNISLEVTKSLRAIPPQFSEEMGIGVELVTGDGNKHATPIGFSYWNDTLQVFPIPIKVDTLYFYCYVEHPALSSDGDAIGLRSAFTQAAIWYACESIFSSLTMTDEAIIYEKKYDKAKIALRERYRNKFDILTGRQ